MRWTIATAALLLAPAALAQGAPMSPSDAIAAAHTSSAGEVAGVFEFAIGSTGGSGYETFLNSQADYRDPRNLSVQISTVPTNALRERLGAHPQDVLTGRRIRVTGVAKRIAIPKRDGTSYYQTRIVVEDAARIEILD